MQRWAISGMSVDDLKAKIRKYSTEEGLESEEEFLADGLYNIVYGNVKGTSKACKDLKKINVDFENVGFIGEFDMPGTEDLNEFEMINEFPVAWCGAGGDWQLPLVFCLYLGEVGELRAYIPSNGNAYDHTNKSAYGEDVHLSQEEEEKMYVFDPIALRDDVKNRIKNPELEIKNFIEANKGK